MGKSDSQYDPQLEFAQKILEEAARLLLEQLPVLRSMTMQIIDLVFVPKVIGRQLALLVALETGMVTLKNVTAILKYIGSNFSTRSRLIRQLEMEQAQANSQDEWMDIAERIDNIQGDDVWRTDPHCALYERDRISARIDEFVHLMRRRDIFELMFVLRGSIGRNKFGLLHPGLFTKARAGTKVLVETYHNVVCAALEFVCDSPVPNGEEPIPTDARLAFFNETRHSYGRTALLLSGGAALGMYHFGVVKTLLENGLMPRVLGGSSAGSIVCAMIGTRTDEELLNDLLDFRGTDAPGHSGQLATNFFRPLEDNPNYQHQQRHAKNNSAKPAADKSDAVGFWEVYQNTAGAFHDARRTVIGLVPIPLRHLMSLLYDVVTGTRRPQDLLKKDTEHLRDNIRLNVGNFTFQEAFDRTGRILNIVVTPSNKSDPPRLLNYLTAPHVLVWSAAVASSSLPGVFEPNRLVVKEADGWERYESGGEQSFWDGSMEQDLPMDQLSEMFNVNHFIISQANPHGAMFASYNQQNSIWSNPVIGMAEAILTFLKNQARSWLLHLVELVGARRYAPLFDTQRGVVSTFFTQEYEGRPCDISLIPWLHHRSLFSAFLHLIYNPSEAEFREWVQAAQRETWRVLPAIKSHIAEEVTLDRCVQKLRKRLVHESWEKHTKLSMSTEQKISDRVPSFFTSPSLVNMGGLTIGDQTNIEGLHEYTKLQQQAVANGPATRKDPAVVLPGIGVNSGWGGLGLRGNRSSGNLQRTASDASGLFIDEEERATEQDAGEQTEPAAGGLPRSKASDGNFANGYVKTTSMARFYYRKSGDSVNDLSSLRKTTSVPAIDENSTDAGNDATRAHHERRKSKSHADLGTSFGAMSE